MTNSPGLIHGIAYSLELAAWQGRLVPIIRSWWREPDDNAECSGNAAQWRELGYSRKGWSRVGIGAWASAPTPAASADIENLLCAEELSERLAEWREATARGLPPFDTQWLDHHSASTRDAQRGPYYLVQDIFADVEGAIGIETLFLSEIRRSCYSGEPRLAFSPAAIQEGRATWSAASTFVCNAPPAYRLLLSCAELAKSCRKQFERRAERRQSPGHDHQPTQRGGGDRWVVVRGHLLHVRGYNPPHPSEWEEIARRFPIRIIIGEMLDEGVCQYFRMLPKLETLGLHRGTFSDWALREIAEVRTLRTLYLPGLAGASDEGLAQLGNLQRLSFLSLSDARIGPSAGDWLGRLNSLRKLSLASCEVHADALLGLGTIGTLKRLSLTRLNLTVECTEALSRLGHLRDLCLSETSLCDAGAKLLESARQFRYLDVSHTRISNESLPGLLLNPSLRILVLDGNEISAGAVARHLAKSLLRRLYVRGCGFSLDEALQLEKLNPKCRIYA